MKDNPLLDDLVLQSESLFADWDDDCIVQEETSVSYRRTIFKRIVLIAVCIVICLVVSGIAVTIGGLCVISPPSPPAD